MACDGAFARSSVKKKELNPAYLERFTLRVADAETRLTVTCWDWDRVGANDFVGKVEIPLSELADKTLRRAVYPLVGRRGSTAKKLGTVELVLAWRFNPRFELAQPSSVPGSEEDPHPAGALNLLSVVVLQARRLLAADASLLREATSDPFVRVRCGPYAQETTVKTKDRNPTFLEVFRLPVEEDDASHLELDVFDHGTGLLTGGASSRTFMGAVQIQLDALRDRAVHRGWHRLGAENGAPDGVDRGRLEVYACWRHSPAQCLTIPATLTLAKQYDLHDQDNFPQTELTIHLIRAKGLRGSNGVARLKRHELVFLNANTLDSGIVRDRVKANAASHLPDCVNARAARLVG